MDAELVSTQLFTMVCRESMRWLHKSSVCQIPCLGPRCHFLCQVPSPGYQLQALTLCAIHICVCHAGFISADNSQTQARCTCPQIVDDIHSDLSKDLCTNMSCSSLCRLLGLQQGDMVVPVAPVDQAVQQLKTWVASPRAGLSGQHCHGA